MRQIVRNVFKTNFEIVNEIVVVVYNIYWRKCEQIRIRKKLVIERIIYYVSLYKKGRGISIINARIKKKLVI